MLTVPDEGFGSQFAFAGPDRLVALNSSAGKYQLTTWDIATGQPIHQIDNLPVAGMPTIAVSPGGKFLVCGTSRRLELIDLDAGRLLAERPIPAVAGRQPEIRGLCFSADGELLAGLFMELGRLRISCWKFSDATLVADSELVVPAAKESARPRQHSIPGRQKRVAHRSACACPLSRGQRQHGAARAGHREQSLDRWRAGRRQRSFARVEPRNADGFSPAGDASGKSPGSIAPYRLNR